MFATEALAVCVADSVLEVDGVCVAVSEAGGVLVGEIERVCVGVNVPLLVPELLIKGVFESSRVEDGVSEAAADFEEDSVRLTDKGTFVGVWLVEAVGEPATVCDDDDDSMGIWLVVGVPETGSVADCVGESVIDDDEDSMGTRLPVAVGVTGIVSEADCVAVSD